MPRSSFTVRDLLKVDEIYDFWLGMKVVVEFHGEEHPVTRAHFGLTPMGPNGDAEDKIVLTVGKCRHLPNDSR